MSLETPTIIHKYDIANLTAYSYWRLYFQEAGTFNINGNIMSGVAGSTVEIEITTQPIYISGGTGLYLLGSQCACGPFYPAYTGSTSNEFPTGTRYYYGNINDNGTRFTTR
jgi:hypothetical protein